MINDVVFDEKNAISFFGYCVIHFELEDKAV